MLVLLCMCDVLACIEYAQRGPCVLYFIEYAQLCPCVLAVMTCDFSLRVCHFSRVSCHHIFRVFCISSVCVSLLVCVLRCGPVVDWVMCSFVLLCLHDLTLRLVRRSRLTFLCFLCFFLSVWHFARHTFIKPITLPALSTCIPCMLCHVTLITCRPPASTLSSATA